MVTVRRMRVTVSRGNCAGWTYPSTWELRSHSSVKPKMLPLYATLSLCTRQSQTPRPCVQAVPQRGELHMSVVRNLLWQTQRFQLPHGIT